MRILDRYILSRFIYNFISSFLIILLIFIFQTIWLYIDELVGKGLSILVVAKFVGLMLPNLIPLILPLTVVLSSIMTLGAFGESYELAAMKASGVSLLKGTRTLIVFMLLLSIAVFFTFNNLQPIKVGKKTGENGEFLHDIVIHKLGVDKLSRTVIKAKEGELSGDKKGANILQLTLKDGSYYEDIKNTNSDITFPFAKAKFKSYTLNIDISSLNSEVNIDENDNKDYYKTMNVSQLSHTLDSIIKDYKQETKDFGDNFYRRTGMPYLLEQRKDSLQKNTEPIENIATLVQKYKDMDRLSQVYSLSKDNINSLINNLDNNKDNVEYQQKLINVYRLTLSDKIALAITCFVLFFVAAPLGAIIRKGGIGMPLVVAIGLFLTYYFSGLLTKNMATNGNIDPYIAPWIPTFFLLPLGIYLTILVNEDKPIGSFSGVADFLKKIFFKKEK